MPKLEVIHQDDALVVIAKPAGRIVIPGRGAAASEPCLRDEVAAAVGKRVYVVHRLDRGTSGVLVFALTPDAHRAMSVAFERRDVDKRYLALCRGEMLGSGEVVRALVPIRGGKMRPARPGEEGGKPSRTSWTAIQRFPGFTWVELQPHSGRLHQIRAHAALLGFPLAVDADYGGAALLRASDLDPMTTDLIGEQIVIDRLTLHAATIRFHHPTTGQSMELGAPLPLDLSMVLEILRTVRQRAR